MIIWAKQNETEFGSNENLEQGKFIVLNKDVPYAEHERIDENVDQAKVVSGHSVDVPYDWVNENVDQAKDASYAEHKRVNESMEQAKDVPYVEHELINENAEQAKDVCYAEHDEQVNESMDQEKVDAFEAILFPTLGKTH
ncbi:unnamed protein product [Arabis nemorensis]|uniref:Uncharacterized protein n=1 Tax=Arabis nemorensis TaxID=586526 RepID=A0A565BK52_9BRAS|nr:unnamed protein product [Arabis nemorensis]